MESKYALHALAMKFLQSQISARIPMQSYLMGGFVIECWLHGADFDLRTGAAVTLPATEALETFQVDRSGNVLTISPKTKEM